MAPVPRSGSALERVLASGRFAVTAEVVPPAAASPDGLAASAHRLREAADALNVTDCHRAQVRISALAASAILLREGAEPVMQVVTRDRNRIALQADLLGAHALGVRNVLCLRGDDPRGGNEPEARGVYEWRTEDLLAAARTLRDRGRLAGGGEVEPRPRFFLGATVNPFAGPSEESFLNLRGKVDAGADFLQTQGVFDVDAFEDWMHLVRKEWLHERVHLLAGVIPLKSARTARFLAERVPGIRIPREVVARLERSSDPRREGLEVAVETVRHLREVEGVRGVHLMAVGWEDAVPEIARGAGLLPRPGV